MRIAFLQTLLFLAVGLFAASFNKATYYQNATNKKKAELKTALYGIIGNPNVKSYGSLWTYFYQTDRTSDNKVIDRYSNVVRSYGSKGSAVNGMNKEHAIANSWWGGTTNNAYSDLHHLMPSDAEANNRKSNFSMGVVTSSTYDNGSIIVGKGKAGNNGTINLWEPADEWKGDFARAYFYIVTCYEELSMVQKEGANTMQSNTYPKLQSWASELYMKWSKEDPVSDIERTRNEAVYSIQGNRNPFVDYEGLEQYIWGTHMDVAFNASNYSNPYGDEVLSTPTATFANASVSLEVGDTYTQTVNTNSDGEVTYVSSNTSVVEVNAQTGALKALAVGTATISAFVAQTDAFASAVVSYSVVVTDGDTPVPSLTGNYYEKVTSEPADWSGIYLIVYEDGEVAMDGGLSTSLDAIGNTIEVTIENDVIASTDAIDAASFTIAPTSSNAYSIQSQSGLYMGQGSDSNGLQSSTSVIYDNTLSLTDEGNVDIIGTGGAHLRYNAASNQLRFRYYKSATYNNQKPIALYRKSVILLGDVNLDGEISIADVTVLVNILLGKTTEYNMNLADVNGDGSLSIADVTALVNLILNK